MRWVRFGAEDAKESLRKAIDVGPGSESAAQADELLRMID